MRKLGLGSFNNMSTLDSRYRKLGLKTKIVSLQNACFFYNTMITLTKTWKNLLKCAADRKASTLDEESKFYKSLTDLNGRSEFQKYIY